MPFHIGKILPKMIKQGYFPPNTIPYRQNTPDFLKYASFPVYINIINQKILPYFFTFLSFLKHTSTQYKIFTTKFTSILTNRHKNL